MEFGILGPLQAVGPHGPVEIAEGKQRAVLAALLLRRGEIVSAQTLIDELWGEAPPATASKALQVHLSKLRKTLGPEQPIETRGAGYVLDLPRGALDLDRFQELAAEGEEALAGGNPTRAAECLREALALWRGEPLADVTLEESGSLEASRLEDLRLAAAESRIEAELALGRNEQLAAELEALTVQFPLRERLHAQLMRALYGAGRQADALAAYKRAREMLLDQLGLEPGPELRRVERAILDQDPSLAPAVARTSLPAAATALVGREAELDAVCELLRDPSARLVTLTGPGGIGKSRLALEAAHRLAPELSHGAAFVPLEAVSDAELVAPEIAAALGVAGGTADALAQALASRRFLLVLDNFEQLLPAAPALAGLLAAAPGLTVLATSRAALRISAEREFPVPPLARLPAVEFFVERAQAVKPGFRLTDENEGAVAEICERLEGLPLAIELAAARIRLLSPASILQRLGRRLDLLVGGPRDAPARQRALRAAVDWSYALLEPDEQRLCARLAAFVGRFGLEAAEAVAGEALAVLDALEALVAHSLLQERDERFAMLETIREYAVERLEESGEAAEIRRRHSLHYLALAEAAEPALSGPDQAAWLTALEAEHGNLSAAVGYALSAGDAETALAIAAAARRFWLAHGHIAEGRRLLADGLAAAPDAPAELLARASNVAGLLAGEQGDIPSAERHFERALTAAEEIGSPVLGARIRSNQGVLAHFAGDFDRAERHFDEGLRLYRKLDDEGGLSVALHNLGMVALARGEAPRAVELLQESRELDQGAGDHAHLAVALRVLARALVAEGDLDEAVGALRESLELAERLDDAAGTAEALETLAVVTARRGEATAAVRLLGRAHALREPIGVPRQADHTAWVERCEADIRGELGEGRFDAELEHGRAATTDEVAGPALGSPRPTAGRAAWPGR